MIRVILGMGMITGRASVASMVARLREIIPNQCLNCDSCDFGDGDDCRPSFSRQHGRKTTQNHPKSSNPINHSSDILAPLINFGARSLQFKRVTNKKTKQRKMSEL